MRIAVALAALLLAAPAAAMPLCDRGPRVDCVVDGDTFWLHGEKIRIVAIDAPEVEHPLCAREAALGRQATARLAALLTGRVEIARTGTDPYRRTLARVRVAGQDIGAAMLAAGLAKPWPGHKADWCGGAD